MTYPYRFVAVLGAVVLTGTARLGDAQSAPERAAQVISDRVVVPGDSGVLDLPVHPAVMTVLYFPDPVRRYVRSDDKNFIVGATGASVAVRPLPDTPAGTYASVNIATHSMRISVRVHVVEAAEDAYVQVSFVPYVVEVVPTVPIKERLSLHVAGGLGRAWIGEDTAGAAPVYLGTVTGLLMVRGSRFHAYEAAVTVGKTTSTRFVDMPFEPDTGDQVASALQHQSLLTRLSLGASAELGTRLTPVLRVHGGVQGRRVYGTRRQVADSIFELSDNRTFWDLTGSAGFALRYRATRRWVLGLGVSVTRALPLSGGSTYDSLEGFFHVGWR